MNEPSLSESIGLDILESEADNEKALIILILMLTDQFNRSVYTKAKQARELVGRLKTEYEKLYSSGIIANDRRKRRSPRPIPGHGTMPLNGSEKR